jgi:hypothetical protein
VRIIVTDNAYYVEYCVEGNLLSKAYMVVLVTLQQIISVLHHIYGGQDSSVNILTSCGLDMQDGLIYGRSKGFFFNLLHSIHTASGPIQTPVYRLLEVHSLRVKQQGQEAEVMKEQSCTFTPHGFKHSDSFAWFFHHINGLSSDN